MTAAKTPETPTRSLHRKLAQVMYEAESIPKNGNFKKPGEYGHFKFVQVGDAANVIRKALAEKNVSMIPTSIELLSETDHETKSGGTMTTMTVRTTWTLTDGDSGETAVIQSMGSGADSGDKASPKAQTNAMKYALLMGFLLSTGDDPELSDSSDRRPRQRDVGTYDEPPEREELERTTHEGGLVGVANLGKNGGASSGTDYQLRQEKDGGHVIGFRLTQGRKGYKVLAFDPLASVLSTQNIIGERVTCWGTMHDESFREEKTGSLITYQVMHLERIATADFVLPAPLTDTPLTVTEPVEAESVPLPLPIELDPEERLLVGGGLADA